MSQVATFAAALVAGLGTLDASVAVNLPYFLAVVAFFALYELVENARSDPYWITKCGFSYNVVYYLALYFFYRQGSGIGANEFVYFQF